MSFPLASGAGGANAAQTLTVKGRIGYRVKLSAVSFSYSAAPTAGRFQMTGAVSAHGLDMDVTAAGLTALPDPETGWVFDIGEDVNMTLAAAGAAVVGKINCGVDWVPID